jgi:hypothetical protein
MENVVTATLLDYTAKFGLAFIGIVFLTLQFIFYMIKGKQSKEVVTAIGSLEASNKTSSDSIVTHLDNIKIHFDDVNVINAKEMGRVNNNVRVIRDVVSVKDPDTQRPLIYVPPSYYRDQSDAQESLMESQSAIMQVCLQITKTQELMQTAIEKILEKSNERRKEFKD